MVGGNLTNRSSRYASAPAPNNGVRHGLGSSRLQLQPQTSAYLDAHADDMTVKSNSGLLPPPRYVLPCFRCRSKKSAAMVLIASAAILISMCSAIIASRT